MIFVVNSFMVIDDVMFFYGSIVIVFIFGISFDVVFMINDCGIIEDLNLAVEWMFGWLWDELLGVNILIIVFLLFKEKYDGFFRVFSFE